MKGSYQYGLQNICSLQIEFSSIDWVATENTWKAGTDTTMAYMV